MDVRNEYANQTIQAADSGTQYQIEALLEKSHFQNEIAKVVGISESALSRELKRNTGDNGYCAELAHNLAMLRRKSAPQHSKIDERQMPIIEKGLILGWSPENISCRMKIEVPNIALSHTSVYNRIADNKAQGGSLYKKLPRALGSADAKAVNAKQAALLYLIESILPNALKW